MKGQVEGSAPKKHIKQTHNRNPTFHSYQLFDVLQPNPEAPQPKRHEARNRSVFAGSQVVTGGLPVQRSELHIPVTFNPPVENRPIKRERVVIDTPRSKSTGKIELDSLHVAQTQFQASKMRNPLYYISSNSFKTSLPVQQAPSVPIRNPLNFQNSRSIIQKQSVDYNIISNLTQI